MNKRRSRPKSDEPTIAQQIEDLVALARDANLPEGAFDGDIEDACNMEALMMMEETKESNLRDQLEFLHQHGFQIGRLAELIREAANPDTR